ncbi:MAG: LuxR family transcriptional regulator [Yoonia sp.]|nr:LuxR family transcriptional regulator [Yoonia sp.]
MQQVEPQDVQALAPAGHYIALRIGFAFPVEEVNELPPEWVDHYTQNRYMLFDPIIRWAYGNVGMARWGELSEEDPRKVIAQAQTFGLRYGAVISVFDGNEEGQRSFGSFARSDREFTELEMRVLQAYVSRRHFEMAPPKNLTMAELEALGMVRDGKRLKQVAHELGVSEGAVKQRLKNAKLKLGAKTGSQAAAMAAQYGLI